MIRPHPRSKRTDTLFPSTTLFRSDLVVVGNHRTWVLAQPFYALLDDAVALAHFLDTHEITIVAVAIDADRNIEIQLVVNFIGLLAAQIPFDAGEIGRAHV